MAKRKLTFLEERGIVKLYYVILLAIPIAEIDTN